MECFIIFVMAWCWFNATESKPHNVVKQFNINIVKMTPEEILKNRGNEKFEVNIGVSLLRLIEITNRSQTYLREIYKEQLTLKEILKGETSIPEGFEDKLYDLEKKIWNASEESYHKLLDGILDTNEGR